MKALAGRTGFDRIAKAYRWLEYLCLGRELERCRLLHLPMMASVERCLVLGDGDGRFTAALVAANRCVHVVAVDTSGAMLELLSARVRQANAASRLTALQGDALSLLRTQDCPALFPSEGFDAVCTHFFLDCLSAEEVEQVVAQVRRRLAPGARWVVSEFETPSWWTRAAVALLYRAFGLLAQLPARRLPPWRLIFACAGLQRVHTNARLGGLLSSSVWRCPDDPARESNHPLNGNLP